MERFQTVARNSAFGLGGRLAIKVLATLFQIYVVRQLGDAGYGQYKTAIAYVGIFSIFSDLGMNSWAVREVARAKRKTTFLLSNLIVLRLMLSTMTIGVMTLTAWMLGYASDQIVGIVIVGLGLFLYAVYGPFDAVQVGNERLDYSATFTVLNQLVFVGVGALALFRGDGFLGLLVAYLLGTAAMTLLSAGVSRRKFGWVQRAEIQPRRWWTLIKSALPFGLRGFTRQLSFRADTVILSLFAGAALTGQYNAAYELVFTLMIISNSVNLALYPTLTRQQSLNPQDALRSFQRAIKFLFALSIPISIGTTILADRIILLLYEAEYAAAIPVLRILIWALPVMYLVELLGYIANVADKERLAARSVAIAAVTNVVLNLILIPRLDIIGAAGTTLITEVLILSQYVWILRPELRLVDIDRTFVRPLAAAALMGVVVFGLRQADLPLAIAGGGVVYGGLLFLTGVLGPRELKQIGGMLIRRGART